MSSWSIDFSPMLPGPYFWAAVVLAAALVAACCSCAATAARFCAPRRSPPCSLALANPTLRQEERESLANIAIVVVDESTSQTIAGRPEQTAAIRTELESKLASIPNLQVAGSRPRSRPAKPPPAPISSPISTARWPIRRPTGSPASS